LAVVQADLQEIKAADPTDLPSILDGVVLSGRRRELLAARWIVSQLLFEGKGEKEEGRKQKAFGKKQRGEGRGEKEEIRGENLLNNSQSQLANSQVSAESLVVATNWQGSLFDSAAAKLQFDLVNLTGLPLEIDILRSTKKRELMSSILRKLQDLLEELRFAQVQQTQLSQKMPAILRNLWEATIIDFFGRYYTLQTGETQVFDGSQTSSKQGESQGESATYLLAGSGVEVVPMLLADADVVAYSTSGCYEVQ
jgi:hypothetical protein